MANFTNRRKNKFVEEFAPASLTSDADTLTCRCKFNFSYFEVQLAGDNFSDWSQNQLSHLLDKLKDFSRETLNYWKQQHIGHGGGRVLSIYGNFPTRSDFTVPKHVPHDVCWGRFRLDRSERLVGFVVPDEYKGTKHDRTGEYFDCNTFYVVFLDANHRFYKTEPK